MHSRNNTEIKSDLLSEIVSQNHSTKFSFGTVDSILATRPAAPGSILGVPKIFSEIISQEVLDVVEIYRQRALLRQWTVQ